MKTQEQMNAKAAGLLAELIAIAAHYPVLRYDGRYDWIPGENRQWTLKSHFIDQDGRDRFGGSFLLDGLIKLGIVGVH